MNSRSRSTSEEIIEANLIPAVVPNADDNPPVITEQPFRLSSISEGPESKLIHHYSRRIGNQQKVPTGLASLAVAEELLLHIDNSYFKCNCDTQYSIKDVTGEEELLIFQASEELSCCSVGSLRNVVIRDREDVPVARACFKEKHWCLHSLVLAVYSPVEVLIGTVEEIPSCSMLSSKFILGNSDGDPQFNISYGGAFFNPHFSIVSLENNKEAIAQIQERNSTKIRLKFMSKLNITNKLILMGFCLGMINKHTHQKTHQPS